MVDHQTTQRCTVCARPEDDHRYPFTHPFTADSQNIVPQTTTKTVRIRVPLLVDSDGKWWSTGWHSAKNGEDEDVLYDMSEDEISDMYAVKWLEADVEVPQQQVVKAEVSDAE